MSRIAALFCLIGLSSPALSFPCFITLAKDSCWGDYNVTVTVQSVMNDNKTLATIIVPEGTFWERQKFECQPKEELRFVAEFNPAFWQEDAGKQYEGARFWFLPEKITASETAWNINLCFPKDFAEVPLPPQAGSNCKCDFSTIPPVPPQ
ncbi:hypothetical protein [Legionella impletisoli]|uniref:Periplasmic protein n=1 Tax=Legionella impletisoli TaxID=343510 RepID=A0A917JQF8_9GAMM|nr:hypothetical protein [Legionella impletisoli]GGI81161.1 hypothetical protein GCM10007966_07030 [Legionella impletisoli]